MLFALTYLRHVEAGVFLADALDDQFPLIGADVFDRDARIVRHDRQVDGLNGFGVGFHPTDLLSSASSTVSRRRSTHTESERGRITIKTKERCNKGNHESKTTNQIALGTMSRPIPLDVQTSDTNFIIYGRRLDSRFYVIASLRLNWKRQDGHRYKTIRDSHPTVLAIYITEDDLYWSKLIGFVLKRVVYITE